MNFAVLGLDLLNFQAFGKTWSKGGTGLMRAVIDEINQKLSTLCPVGSYQVFLVTVRPVSVKGRRSGQINGVIVRLDPKAKWHWKDRSETINWLWHFFEGHPELFYHVTEDDDVLLIRRDFTRVKLVE